MAADVHSRETRSYNMSRIRGRDTKPEIRLRSMLHRAGFRFRVNDRRLPGKPDIVFPRYRTVVMVHGCFWHRHENCPYCTTPATRPEFWNTKFAYTVQRDATVREQLESLGWKVITVWECELKKTPEKVVESVSEELEKRKKH